MEGKIEGKKAYTDRPKLNKTKETIEDIKEADLKKMASDRKSMENLQSSIWLNNKEITKEHWILITIECLAIPTDILNFGRFPGARSRQTWEPSQL